MAGFFFEYGLFLAKCLTFVLTIGAIAFISMVLTKAASEGKSGSRVRFSPYHHEHVELQESFFILSEDNCGLERLRKASEASKSKEKTPKKGPYKESKSRVFLLDFDGDADAKTDGNLEKEIEAIISVGRSDLDEVVVKLKSPGGYVHSYGIAAEHLKRLKEAGMKLTVCVDEIAASGGYMMACVADKIIAAPFATLGSIGVVAGIPNVNGLLKKHGVEYEDFIAGEFKRTVTTMGEITPEGRAKFQKDLETIHDAFKAHVKEHRSDLDVSDIATGESWLGRQALEKGLVDEIGTSGRLIHEIMKNKEVFAVRFKKKKELSSQLSRFLVKTTTSTVGGVRQSLSGQPKY